MVNTVLAPTKNWPAGSGVKDYQPLLSSGKANQTHLKTATEFGSRLLGHGSFGASLVRHALFAIREVVRTDEVQPGKNWLRTEVSNYWQQRKICALSGRFASSPERFAVSPSRDPNGIEKGAWER